MRTFWLASTALLMSAGIAAAQSAPTASPAPTGAVSAPQVAPSNASPGNMAPGTPTSSASMNMSSAAKPGSATSTPAPDGAVNAPAQTAASQGAAPGKMAPGNSGSSNNMASMPNGNNGQSAMNAPPSGMSSHSWHHHWTGSSSLPANASPAAYLHIAKNAIKHHNVTLADDALSHAETRLLNRSVPQGQISADDSPSIQSIESARQALHAGNFTKASADTRQAAGSVNGM